MAVFQIDKPFVFTEADGVWRDLRPNYDPINVERNLKFFTIPGKEEHGEQPYILWDHGRKMRVRCEVLMFDETGKILMKLNPTFKRYGDAYSYDLPGGGIGKGETIVQAAAREAMEEARIEPKDIEFTGIHYAQEATDDSKKEWGTWGYISFVCVAKKGRPYTGYINPIDREESFIKKMKWISLQEIDIIPAHEEAVRWYKNKNGTSLAQGINEAVSTDNVYVNTFLSGKDVYVNFDKWKSGKNNKLFIIGMSGSGKSTLGNKLAKQYHCYVVHTDRFRGNVHYSEEALLKEDPLVYKYFEEIWGLNKRFDVKTLPKAKRNEEFKKFVYWVLQLQERVIIEGAVEKILIENEKLQTYPIIFKGTSMMKSMFRMLKRELIEKPTFESAPITWILKFLTKYSDMKELNNQARDSILQHNPDYDKFQEAVAEFKPMEGINHGFEKHLKSTQDLDTYVKTFKADEKEWMKKITFVSDERIRGGKPQPVIKYKNGDYRARAEVLVFDPMTGKVLIDPGRHRGFMYTLPGGGLDKPKDGIIAAARRECEEEARIIPKKIIYTGLAWELEFFNPEFNKGMISFMCIAERGPEYKGYIKKEDRDPFVDRAKWVDIDKLGEPHQKAIEAYKKQHISEAGFMEIDRSFLDADYLVEETGYLPQPIVFSDNDVYVNFEKFKNKEIKTCLITGLSGSGKSTLGKKIAEAHNAYYVATDTISFKISSYSPEHANWTWIKEHDKYLYQFLKEKELDATCMLKYPWNGNEKNEIVTPFVKWVCCERKDDGMVVLEGGDVAIALRDVPELKDYPIIFKGTSIVKSMVRRFLRAAGKKGLKVALDHVVNYFYKQYAKMIPEVQAARKAILSNNEYKLQHEATALSPGYAEAKQVYDTLTPEDKKLCSPRGQYVDSPNLAYRYVYKISNVPIGFIDCYKYNGKNTSAFILLAVSPEYRSKGIAKQMLAKAEFNCKKLGFFHLIYRVDKENESSINLAKAAGFELQSETKNQMTFIKTIN